MESQSHIEVTSGTSKSFAKFDTISEAFVSLTSQLNLLLDKADFSNLRRSCIEQSNTPNGVQLPPELVQKIKSSENSTKLFEILADSTYWTWNDIRLLKSLVCASGLVDARDILSDYMCTKVRKLHNCDFMLQLRLQC